MPVGPTTILQLGACGSESQQRNHRRMSLEGQLLDQKSLRAVTGKSADWNEIAKDCIAFANATGGRYFLRVADQSKPVTGNDVMRLASERSALPWETQTTLKRIEPHRLTALIMAHVTAFPDLAQKRLYLPSLSQGVAPSSPALLLTNCCLGCFSLAHTMRLSQSVGSAWAIAMPHSPFSQAGGDNS